MINDNRTFGEAYFEKIDDNEYLNKLFEDILYNYAVKRSKSASNTESRIKSGFAAPFSGIQI